jgi:hypothetical protein
MHWALLGVLAGVAGQGFRPGMDQPVNCLLSLNKHFCPHLFQPVTRGNRIRINESFLIGLERGMLVCRLQFRPVYEGLLRSS